MQFIYIKDLVAACLRAMEEPGANGHAFNIANPRAITQAEVIAAFAEPRARSRGDPCAARADLPSGRSPHGPQLYFGFYFDVAPITLIVTKAQRVLGFKPTDFVAGLKGDLPLVPAPPAQARNRLQLRRPPPGPGCSPNRSSRPPRIRRHIPYLGQKHT